MSERSLNHDAVIERLAIIETKLDGVNRRLDISNGRIAKSELVIQDLRMADAEISTTLQDFAAYKQHQTEGVEKFKYWVLNNLGSVTSSVMGGLILSYLVFHFGF